MSERKIGMQIKKARLEAQLTQAQLGKKIGVSWEMISRYENGKSSARQNLEKLSEVLGKPIQYFFGVEELPLTEEIQKLSTLLEEKGDQLKKRASVAYLDSLANFELKKALRLTSQTYTCSSWIHANFEGVFALKLDKVESQVVSIKRDDIGFFTIKVRAKPGEYVLVDLNGQNFINKYSKKEKGKVLATLVAIEKRFLDPKRS